MNTRYKELLANLKVSACANTEKVMVTREQLNTFFRDVEFLINEITEERDNAKVMLEGFKLALETGVNIGISCEELHEAITAAGKEGV